MARGAGPSAGTGSRGRAIEVAAQGANERRPLLGVTAAGVGGLAHVGRRELALALPPHFGEARVVEKASLVEGGDEPLGGVPHLHLAGETGDGGPQVAFILLPVETAEAACQERRNHQRDIRVMEGIANQKAPAVRARARA